MEEINNTKLIEIGKSVVEKERDAVSHLLEVIDETFVEVVHTLSSLEGKLIITGMGKSGNIARKIASTLSSIGLPSLYLNPAEAKHGDLGVIKVGDVVMLLSNSGETDELNSIINYCKRFEITIIGMTRKGDSTLYNVSNVKIVLPAIPEASHLGVPTTSSTMMIVYGDAIAVALHHKNRFSKESYHILHPGGQIGARLTYVKSIMHTGSDIPMVNLGTPLMDAVLEMTKKRFGCVGIVNEKGELQGIITDGDLRRNIEYDIRAKKVDDIMHYNPKVLQPDIMAFEAMSLMNKNSITNVFVVEGNKPIGIIHIHDLLKLGVA